MDYDQKIQKSKSFADIFGIVKEMVYDFLGAEQAGLMVGVTDLGLHDNGCVGAFYLPSSNMIVINKKPLARILQTKPPMYNYYLFHVILHEYVHSIGAYDEAVARKIVSELSEHYFGNNHIVTHLTKDINRFLPDLAYPGHGFLEPSGIDIEFIKGIDRKNTNYIN